MKTVTKAALGLLTAIALSWVPAAYAANSTEFGVEGDLTVLGTGGNSALDPDVEIKGFTVFGSTQSSYPGGQPITAGNVVINGVLSVSSGAYFVGGSTFSTGGAYFTGVSSFSDVANVHFGGGAAGQVLKKVAGAGMVWANDATGLSTLGSVRRLQMVNNTADGLIDSAFIQNAGDTNITMYASSSMTILGAFEAAGAAKMGGTLNVTGAATLSSSLGVTGVTSLNGAVNLGDAAADLVTIQGPVTVMNTSSITVQGAFEADGAIILGNTSADLLTMNAQATFVGGSTFTTGAYFTGISSFSNVANVHFAGGTVNQVLKKVAGGGMVWGDDNTGLTSLGSPRRLQMVNNTDDGLIDSMFIQNAGDTNITMYASSSMTILGAFEAAGAAKMGGTLNVTGAATLSSSLGVTGVTSLNGAVNLGDAAADLVTIQGPVTVMNTSSITVQGAFEADGAIKLGDTAADLLTINGQSSFVAGSTFTIGAYFTGISSFSNVANVHFAGGTAGQVLKKVAGGGMVWGNDATGLTALGTARRLQMVNDTNDGLINSMFIQNAGDTNITMYAASSMTILGAFEADGAAKMGSTLDVTGATTLSSLLVTGNAQLGNAITDIHGVNGAPEANVALAVHGESTDSTKYAAKFYSNATLAAWIRHK